MFILYEQNSKSTKNNMMHNDKQTEFESMWYYYR